MKEFLISLLNFFGLATWIEIVTTDPDCTYYFGPFMTAQDAEAEQKGYIEDLEREDSTLSQVTIKRCKPSELTISSSDEASEGKVVVHRFSAQS